MKYIRTYETEEKFLTDKDSTSRGFRLKPTLYKYSEAGDHVHLEIDDPRKHGDSTYMEITLDSDTEFSFYIGNKSGDTQTTMNCSIDWGDGTVETKTITKDDKGFKLAHSYVTGSYKIELYDVERGYSIIGTTYGSSSISHSSNVKRVILGSGSSIGGYAFEYCESLASVYIPESVTSINLCAFWKCTSLTSVYIPESVTSIEYGAFANCFSLTSVYIPERVTSIGGSAFTNCSSLTSVYIPERVTSIKSDAFSGCTGLTSIRIPERVTSIESNTFANCSSLTSVHIPESVTSIDYGAFANCSSLTSVYIPERVTSISGFSGCTGLTSINIPEGVTSIGGSAFTNCSSLTSIHIPEGVTSIKSDAFSGCTGLTSIRIPERVTTIGAWAFEECYSLTSISSFNTTAPTLSNSVFQGLPTNGTLHIKLGATGYDVWLKFFLPSGWTIVEDL